MARILSACFNVNKLLKQNVLPYKFLADDMAFYTLCYLDNKYQAIVEMPMQNVDIQRLRKQSPGGVLKTPVPESLF